jgi:hypothetical protein
LAFPARLRFLAVRFARSAGALSDKQQRDLDAAVAVIATLPLLESLTFSAEASCCLAPLTNAPVLRTLELDLSSDALDPLKARTALEALRHMPHLRSLRLHAPAEAFTRLLQPPHALLLDTLGYAAPFTSAHADAIVPVAPTLTNLTFNLHSSCPHTDFLRQLPRLRRLQLNGNFFDRYAPLDAERVMASLHALKGMTDLFLVGGSIRFTSDHLEACLPQMPLLASLHLSNTAALDSLRFLSSSGSLVKSLKELKLTFFQSRLLLAELAHVHALSALTLLHLMSVFDRAPDEAVVQQYRPPSLLLPSLTDFICRHTDPPSSRGWGC